MTSLKHVVVYVSFLTAHLRGSFRVNDDDFTTTFKGPLPFALGPRKLFVVQSISSWRYC